MVQQNHTGQHGATENAGPGQCRTWKMTGPNRRAEKRKIGYSNAPDFVANRFAERYSMQV